MRDHGGVQGRRPELRLLRRISTTQPRTQVCRGEGGEGGNRCGYFPMHRAPPLAGMARSYGRFRAPLQQSSQLRTTPISQTRPQRITDPTPDSSSGGHGAEVPSGGSDSCLIKAWLPVDHLPLHTSVFIIIWDCDILILVCDADINIKSRLWWSMLAMAYDRCLEILSKLQVFA